MSAHRTGLLLLAAFASAAYAQLTPMDAVFAGLSARTRQMAYQARGGDMAAIAPLMADATNADRVRAYRSITHAMVLMEGAWTPDSELPTGLDFAIGAKLVGPGENLATRAAFLFDAPSAANGPYRMQLDLLKPDGAKEAAVEPGIVLGDVRGRKQGETVGLTFDPSRLAPPGLHTIRATLQDGHGAKLFEYYRTFFLVADLGKRTAALEKTLDLLSDQRPAAAMAARQLLETIQIARTTYYGTGFQNLTGYVFTGVRAGGLGATEAVDFEPALTRAAKLATALKEGQADPLAAATGDLGMAYRSTFDGKLVPYRIYVPANYDKSKKYPLVVLLHGAGGDETNFLEGYGGLWPKLAGQRGYVLASVNGRGPLSGYTRDSGGEQDVVDVTELVKSRYSIDSSRVYLGGHSMGGGGTWRIGLSYASKFAGLIPIAGSSTAVVAGLEALSKTGRSMPVIMVCGVKDALVAVAGCRTVAEKARDFDPALKYAEYADGDHLSVAVMSVPDIFDWLDAQKQIGASLGKK